jgi:hypothetical protein
MMICEGCKENGRGRFKILSLHLPERAREGLCTCGLFNNVDRSSNYIPLINGISCLERLKKITKKLKQDSRTWGLLNKKRERQCGMEDKEQEIKRKTSFYIYTT